MSREYDRLAYDIRQQREAMAELRIKSSAVDPPAYDNSDLFSLARWTANNLGALARYLVALDARPDEYRDMTLIQYERQLALRELDVSTHDDDRQEQERRVAEYRAWHEPHESGLPEQGEI